jgi:hypothetical protein
MLRGPLSIVFPSVLQTRLIGRVWASFPKISEAMDGRREAHMEVLVAVFGKEAQILPAPKSAG